MSRHNYTNPAFCQQSEFYQTTNSRSVTSSPAKVHRSESIRSNSTVRSATGSQRIINYQQPPRLGPKPSNRYDHLSSINQEQTSSGRYALVPVEEIPNGNKGRYAVLPMSEIAPKLNKSLDNLDRYASLPFNVEEPRSLDSTPFASLPPSVHPQDELTKISRAFSSDFGSKPFVIVDQKSQQRYAVVPTEENEELVDENHEIIQMHNGKAHRYAVIPTDEEETNLGDFELSPINHHGYATIKDSPQRKPATSTPQRMYEQSPQHRLNQPNQQQQPPTPQKNNLATQRLHELLSTPQKKMIKNGTPKNSPQYYTPPQKNPQMRPEHLTPKRSDFTPQKLQYEQQSALEQRTTAVIIPRLAPSIYSETTSGSHNKSWNNLSFHKVANATATIGVVSLMLILCGAMNSGLCLYMIHNFGRSYYLDIGIMAGFAGVGLGLLGFKSRQCDWLPNRNYISGYILVTVFSLLNCCGLLVLLAMRPFPGTPLHDVTTGVTLGLSSLTILIISLGVITSRWCLAPPPDNRVDVY